MENKYLEYKEKITDPLKQVINTLIAFTNTGGGVLKIGIDDNGNKVSILNPPTSEKVANWINEYFDEENKSIVINLYHYSISRDNIVSISIGTSHKAIKNIKGDYYIRIGSTTRKSSKKDIEILKNELSMSSIPYKSSDFQKLLKINDKFASNNFLRKSYSIEREGLLTQLGLLIRDERKAVFVNAKAYNILDFPKIVDFAIESFDKKIIDQGKKIRLLNFIDNIDVVIRELIGNALVHSGTSIPIWIEFGKGFLYTKNQSTSNFINMINKKEIYHDTNFPQRNRLFKKLGFIEAEGQGYNEEIVPNEKYKLLIKWENDELEILLIVNKLLKNKNMNSIDIDDLKDFIFLKHFCILQGNRIKLKEGVKIYA